MSYALGMTHSDRHFPAPRLLCELCNAKPFAYIRDETGEYKIRCHLCGAETEWCASSDAAVVAWGDTEEREPARPEAGEEELSVSDRAFIVRQLGSARLFAAAAPARVSDPPQIAASAEALSRAFDEDLSSRLDALLGACFADAKTPLSSLIQLVIVECIARNSEWGNVPSVSLGVPLGESNELRFQQVAEEAFGILARPPLSPERFELTIKLVASCLSWQRSLARKQGTV